LPYKLYTPVDGVRSDLAGARAALVDSRADFDVALREAHVAADAAVDAVNVGSRGSRVQRPATICLQCTHPWCATVERTPRPRAPVETLVTVYPWCLPRPRRLVCDVL